MKIGLVLFLSLLFHLAYGQKMYMDSMFNKINTSTHTFKNLEGISLELDYYRAEGASGKLPLIVYVHGGGFSTGTRNSQGIQYFAKRLAKRGYAVASISYRLTLKDAGEPCEISEEQKINAITFASYDVTSGVKHIVDNNSVFSVDEKKIILVGSSAGGEAVLNMVYGMDYSDAIIQVKYAGVVSMSGSLLELDGVTTEKAIPTQLFHGTADDIVPYEKASHNFCKRFDPGHCMMYGSKLIAEQLNELEVSYYLYTIQGGTHSWAGIPTKRCFTEILDFVYNDVLYPNLLRQTERTITEKK